MKIELDFLFFSIIVVLVTGASFACGYLFAIGQWWYVALYVMFIYILLINLFKD